MNTTHFEIKTKSKIYQVYIGESLLTNIVDFLDDKPKRVFVITDETVAKLYLETLTQSLKESGVETISEILADGESTKTLDTVFNLYNFLLENEASRSDMIIAFGGGVIGDITGFVASTFKRGLNFLQIPTTLLAQVDSAIGGKTGVNLNGGKNLVGTFYQPSAVIVDVTVLKTLSETDFITGLAEVIKYGVIMDSELLQILIEERNEIVNRESEAIIKIVERSLKNKARIVSLDEREEYGIREILNFGHTIGHAIESSSSYDIVHGQAVAIGMVEEARFSVDMDLLDIQSFETIVSILESYHLPTSIPDDMKFQQLREIVKHDKKIREGVLRIPILVELGKVEMKSIELSSGQDVITSMERNARC